MESLKLLSTHRADHVRVPSCTARMQVRTQVCEVRCPAHHVTKQQRGEGRLNAQTARSGLLCMRTQLQSTSKADHVRVFSCTVMLHTQDTGLACWACT